MTGFQPGDRVRALLWPELGTGQVTSVSQIANNAAAARVARVHWETGQKSTHSFAALAHLDPESPSHTHSVHETGHGGP